MLNEISVNYQNKVLLESLKRIAQENPMFAYELATKAEKQAMLIDPQEPDFQNYGSPPDCGMCYINCARAAFHSRRTGRNYDTNSSRTTYKSNEPVYEDGDIVYL